MSDFKCPLPWTGIELDAIGRIKPCCLAREAIQENGKDVSVRTHTITEAMNSDYMKNLRQRFLNGDRPETCSPCWDTEATGQLSKRIHSINKMPNTIYDEDHIKTEFMDVKLGNICNIKCRICGSDSSSMWVTENFKLYGDRELRDRTIKNGSWPRTTESVWDQLEKALPHLRYMEITGGEPFLIEQQFDLLRRAVDNGYAKDIEIHYNTNGTIYPDDAIKNIWPHFKKVEIAFSIDDINERFHYQRFPAKWDDVKDNVQRIHDLKKSSPWLQTQICCTINKQNIYYLPEVCEYINSLDLDYRYFNLLHGPLEFHIAHCSPEFKTVCANRIVKLTGHLPYFVSEIIPIINFLMEDKPCTDDSFVTRINEIDKSRGQSFKDTFPEIYPYFHDE